MRWLRFAFAPFAMLAIAAMPVHGATIADSVADWSVDGTQGENGWFYGWYNLTNDTDANYAPGDFQPFLNDGSDSIVEDNLNQWNGTSWILYRDTAATAGAETGPWTRISATGGHPNGTNSAAPILVDEPEQAEHWAIRRWVSTYAGPVSAISTLTHTNVACGNGTSVQLYQNGTLMDKLTNSAATPMSNTVGMTLAVGDIVDFALTPEGVDGGRGDGCDGSDFMLMLTDDPPPPPVIPPLADSLRDWSTTGTQGEKNWFNGYYNLTADSDATYQVADFTPFDNLDGPAGGPVTPDGNHWNGTRWDLDPSGGPWTELGASNTHPNGTNSAPNEEHWTVRRYVASDLTQTTPVEITWETAKTNLGGGNGVAGVLFVNGEQVDTATVAFNDGTGVTRKYYVNANPGDVIDLALTPNGPDGADGSRNRLTLRTDLPDGPLYNPGEKVADSVAEFSGVQGQDNWFYGYFDLRDDAENRNGEYDTEDFIPFMNDDSGFVTDDQTIGAWKDYENHWNGSKWDLLANTSNGPWTELTANGGHPAANAQGDPEVHWSVRRWVSQESGDFEIAGILNNGSANGDGTVGRIFVDGQEVWSAASDGDTIPLDVMVSLTAGSIVDFAIDPDGAGNYNVLDPTTVNQIADGNDGTAFFFTIAHAPTLFIPGGGSPGDYDGDGQLTAADIDLLSAAVRSGATDAKYDLNGDNAVNAADREVWVNELKKTYFGDSNLDGEFNSSDFVFVFGKGEYEDGVDANSTWASGDWNGDTEFDSSDFVTAFQAGGYEAGQRGAVSAVPEPSSLVLLAGGLLCLISRRRR